MMRSASVVYEFLFSIILEMVVRTILACEKTDHAQTLLQRALIDLDSDYWKIKHSEVAVFTFKSRMIVY